MAAIELSTSTRYSQWLQPEPSSAATARRFCRDVLRCYGLDCMGDLAELLVSELVTNAVLHTGAPCAVHVQIASNDRFIRVEVDDESPLLPYVVEVGPFAEHGRGVMLVETLATRWGVEAGDSRKTVWFELEVDYCDVSSSW